MIPYEELERALSRWKARRTGTVELPETASLEHGAGDKTPPPVMVMSGSVEVGSGVIEVRDSTGELELSDAEVDEAQ